MRSLTDYTKFSIIEKVSLSLMKFYQQLQRCIQTLLALWNSMMSRKLFFKLWSRAHRQLRPMKGHDILFCLLFTHINQIFQDPGQVQVPNKKLSVYVFCLLTKLSCLGLQLVYQAVGVQKLCHVINATFLSALYLALENGVRCFLAQIVSSLHIMMLDQHQNLEPSVQT